MISSSRIRSLVFGLVATALVSPVSAQGGAQPVEEFDPSRFPGYVMDDVVVPVPSEIFAVLDKLGEPNWKQELRKVKASASGDRALLSMLFGLAVAEGFVAVQAQDRKAVEDIGREVIDIATALGLKKAVNPHANAILEAADKDDWSTIRKEFDRTQATVRDTMESLKDAPLAQCVSIGGWLRGTAAVTSVVGKNYSNDSAELLYQPMLVDHFLSQIQKMPDSIKNNAAVSSAKSALAEIKAVMDRSAEGFAPDSVGTISKSCEQMLKVITTK
ncbi:MAG: hypothetical protein JNJ83_17255 [Verrucomicrobiaceae bacterium]|nr:hypothetical protein [Verrucomicrobiaceae bacterium]